MAISLSSLLLFLVHLLLPAYLAAGLPGPSISESIGKLRFGEELTPPGLRFLDSTNGGTDGEEERGGSGPRRNTMIIGTTLLGSGIFLCSWGITAWEIQEYQCCPARNTGNVVKIVAGIVLINGGLMYLLGASD
jgi:hypothetical protein